MSKSVQQVQELREKYGEQHFQVQHYLALWKSDKSKANWERLLGAVEGWAAFSSVEERDALLRQGKKVYSLNHHRRITRWRMGSRGGVYAQNYNKTNARWSKSWS